jgi:hypothetical protein
MKTVVWILAIATMPFVYLDVAASIVSGAWLAIAGDWPAFTTGVVLFFLGHYFLSFTTMPGLALGGIGALQLSGTKFRRFLGAMCLVAGGALQYIGFLVFIGLSYYLLLDYQFTSPLWIAGLWAFSLVSGSFNYLAVKEIRANAKDMTTDISDIEGIILATSMAQIIAFVWALAFLFQLSTFLVVVLTTLWFSAILIVILFSAIFMIARRSI